MKVSLRRETEKDWPWLWQWRHGTPDAEWKQWDSPFLHAHTRPLSYEEFVDERVISTRLGAIIEVDGRPIGTVNRTELAPFGGGWWDWGIVIYDPRDRGFGFGTVAAALWINNTFHLTNAHVLTLTTWSGNSAMIATGYRLGFTECTRVPQARLWQGERYDVVQMAMLKEHWEKQNAID